MLRNHSFELPFDKLLTWLLIEQKNYNSTVFGSIKWYWSYGSTAFKQIAEFQCICLFHDCFMFALIFVFKATINGLDTDTYCRWRHWNERTKTRCNEFISIEETLSKSDHWQTNNGHAVITSPNLFIGLTKKWLLHGSPPKGLAE